MNRRIHCIPCNRQPVMQTDQMTKATFVECGGCGRVVGAPSEEEAGRMWAATMAFFDGAK